MSLVKVGKEFMLADLVIENWLWELELLDWEIGTLAISEEQVDYPNDCIGEERFFIGINYDLDKKKGTIYHSRDLTEEDIVHELLHTANPEWTEDQVNEETTNLLDRKYNNWCYYAGMPSPKAYID